MRNVKDIALLTALVLLCLLVWSPQSLSGKFGWNDSLELLVTLRSEIVNNFVDEPDQDALIRAAAKGMTDSLGDPYTTYLAPDDMKQFDKSVRGTFSGIGAEIIIDDTVNRLKIVSPLEESPAWNAGVLAGDLVLEIDGKSTDGISIQDAVDQLTGPRGTEVVIKVRHPSGEEEVIPITRAQINVQTVKGYRRGEDRHWDFMIDKTDHVGYVRLTQFTDRTSSDLADAIESLKTDGCKGLILDVRFNPGGLLSSAVSISDMFLGEGQTIVSIKGRTVPDQIYKATDKTLLPDIPVVILANGQSASASEIVTGALADNDRAIFIGTRTFGKGSVQQVRMLGNDQSLGALKMTTSHYYGPSGRNIHRTEGAKRWGVDPKDGFYVGMTPDEVTEMIKTRRQSDLLTREGNGDPANLTPESVKEKLKDGQLAAALETMLAKLSTGEWKQVGLSDAGQQEREVERLSLIRQRDFLTERLAEIRKNIAELETERPAEPADDAAAVAPKPEPEPELEESPSP